MSLCSRFAVVLLCCLAAAPLVAAIEDLQAELNAAYPTARVRVVSEGGIVLLRGTVADADQKIGVETATRRAGYTRVANLLAIAPPPSDEDLRRSVENAMRDIRALQMSETVSVRAANGVVHVSGTIAPELEPTLIDIISRVDGVRDVVIDRRR